MKNNQTQVNDIYLTKSGLVKLVEELDELKRVKRPEIIRVIKEALSYGDLSENAEYHSACEEQGSLESRISELEHVVEHAIIIDENVSKDIVTIGSSVMIKYDGDDNAEEYHIVGSKESNPFENKISNESPIAKAILGQKPGAVVTVDSPNGKFNVEIVSIN